MHNPEINRKLLEFFGYTVKPLTKNPISSGLYSPDGELVENSTQARAETCWSQGPDLFLNMEAIFHETRRYFDKHRKYHKLHLEIDFGVQYVEVRIMIQNQSHMPFLNFGEGGAPTIAGALASAMFFFFKREEKRKTIDEQPSFW